MERGTRNIMVGVVVSDRMQKTITVDVERIVRHPIVGKYLKRYTRCYAHDEKNEAKAGDKVEIMETRPMSRRKRWRLVKVLARGTAEPVPAQG